MGLSFMPKRLYLDSQESSILDWIDAADEQGRLELTIFAKPCPSPLAEVKFDKWLRESLKDINKLQFFFRLRSVTPRPFDAKLVEVHSQGQYEETTLNFSLPNLLNLPGINPQQELAQMKKFYLWVQEKVKESGQQYPGIPRIQWYRGGYGKNNKGLEFAGIQDPETKVKFQEELNAWTEKKWFKDWYELNIDALK